MRRVNRNYSLRLPARCRRHLGLRSSFRTFALYKGTSVWSVTRWVGSAAIVAMSALHVAIVTPAFAIDSGLPTHTAGHVAGGVTKPNDAKSGTLLLHTEKSGEFVEAPRLGTDYNIDVSGSIARTVLTQRFVNPSEGWVEAVYVFPLPENSAVDTLRMIVGEKVIVGEIKERQKARVIYERAKANGQKSALVEQQRPNIFTHNVANIGPGESVVVQIEYQHTVRRSGEKYSLRVPLVVAPRFSPKPIVQTVDFNPNGGGWGQIVDPVPDRDKITAPVLDPSVSPPTNPVTLQVKLNAGFPLSDVTSHHHTVAMTTPEAAVQSRVIKLKQGAVPADRDFELTWQGQAGGMPSVGLFQETINGESFVLAMVTPPKLPEGQKPPRQMRDVTFVIDTSGSMGGHSIRQARASLVSALARLNPQDRFNIIRFSSEFDALFQGLEPANASNIATATSYVSQLDAQGGTMMVPPMQAALAMQGSRDHETGNSGTSPVRQIIFLTDGAIGNEEQLFETLAHQRRDARIFMVGIGSAPNSFLMKRAAEIGQGTFMHIGSDAQVSERMSALFQKLENPAITDLKAVFEFGKADMAPGVLPDLYYGEPIVLAAKVSDLKGRLTFSGNIGPNPWQVHLPLEKAAKGTGLSKLWARRKISDLEASKILRTVTYESAEKEILQLALKHQLVSRLTSLIAVEKTPSRPTGKKLTRTDIPLNLPEGWDFKKVFGKSANGVEQRADVDTGKRQDATLKTPLNKAMQGPGNGPHQAKLQAAAYQDPRFARVAQKAMPIMNLASAKHVQHQVILPQTATDAELRIMIGLALMLLASLLLWRLRGPSAIGFYGWRKKLEMSV